MSDCSDIKLCGLDKRQIRSYVSILESISHAATEGNWEALKSFEYSDELNKYLSIVEGVGCMSPPHGLIEPTLAQKTLVKHVKNKSEVKTLKIVNDLILTVFDDF